MENLFARAIPTRVFGNFRKSFTFLGVLGALCLSMSATPLWAVCTPTEIDDGADAVTCTDADSELGVYSDGVTITTAIDLAGGNDTFDWGSDSAFGAGGSISGGDGSDTLKIEDTLALDGALFTNFEVLTVNVRLSVTQTNTLDLGEDGAATFSVGTYSISAGGVLQVNTITVSGGTLAGAGAIMMGDGASTFTISSGSVAVAVDLGAGDDTFTWSGTATVTGTVNAGAGSDTLALGGGASGDTIAIDGGNFIDFEVLTVSQATSQTTAVTQSGTLDLGSGSATFSGGTYTIAGTSGVLQANVIELSGGTLNGAGAITLGDGASTFTVSGGTAAIAVNLGAGDDTFTWSGGIVGLGVNAGTGSDTLALADGTLALNGTLFDNFEVLTVSQSAGETTAVTQTNDLVLVGSSSATFSGGTYTIADDADLQVNTITVDGGTIAVVTAGTGTDGIITMGTGDVASSFTIESGSVAAAVTSAGGADTFTVSGGTVSGAVATGAGADTFTVSGTGTVSGAVNLGAGDDTFTVSGGTVTGAVNAGAGTDDRLVLSGGTEAVPLAVNGTLFTNFESLTVTSGFINQTGNLVLGTSGSGTVEISGEGTSYTVAASANLGAVGNAVAITMRDTSELVIAATGTVHGDISGDDAAQTIQVFGNDPFGTAARTVDLGGGVDELEVNIGTAGVDFANSDLTFQNIEVLHLSGSHATNKFDWDEALTIGSATGYDGSGFHTLKFDVGGDITSVENIVFADGSTIIINDIATVSTKSVSFSSDGTITLPESGERLSIALHSTSGAAFTVTLTLSNVTLADAAAFEALKETLSVVDSTKTVTGSVEIVDVTDFSSAVDLSLTLELPAHFVSVTGGNAQVTTLNSIFTAGDTPPALLTAAQTAASAASNPGLASVSFANSLVPEDYAHFSPLVARSQSLTVGRILDRLGSGSTAQSDDVTNTDSWTSRSKPWVSISTRSGELDTTDDESGYDNSIEMAVAGIDIALGGGGVFGAFAGRSELTQELNSKDRKDLGAGNPLKNFSKINYSTAFFGVYGERRLSNLRLSLLGSYATGNASVRGATEIGTTLQRRKADFDMDILSGQLRVSWDFEGRVFGMQVEPVLDAIWTKVDRSSVDETRTIGNVAGIVRIGEDRYESLIASGGFNLTQQDDRKRIDISVGWRQEIKDGDPASRATVTGASTSAFDVDGRTPWSGAAYISASIGRAQQAFGSQGYIELFLDHENDLDEYEGFSLGVRIRSTF